MLKRHVRDNSAKHADRTHVRWNSITADQVDKLPIGRLPAECRRQIGGKNGVESVVEAQWIISPGTGRCTLYHP
ncbi:hypothetical protein [Sphingomonas sp. IW22]|uniref:hypothetical protein n=1 Tax=Sphingomonas sp. IW22 TaxID=3242489 RepID=UPI003520BE8F